MEAKIYSFDKSDISISALDIGRWIGYPPKSIPPAIEAQIEIVLQELLGLISMKGGFKIYNNISLAPTTLQIVDKKFQIKKIIARSFKEASSIAVFAGTIGSTVSKWTDKLIKEDALNGYIADVAASCIAEKNAENVQNKIEEYAKSNGECISTRYSPGYCGWSVAEQHLLFSLLPDNICGITLNEAAMMTPVKSVSGIIGIGKIIKKNPYQCNICDVTDCIMSPIGE